MSDRLEGRVALVTGGGSGIGKAAASVLSVAGATVVVVGRRLDRLDVAVAQLAGPAGSIAADLTGPDAAAEVIDEVIARFGRLDVVVHAAGVFEKRPVEDTDPTFWRSVQSINLDAVVQLTRAAWPHLKSAGGQVVLVSSAAATKGFPDNGAYAASKGAMNAFGEVLRVEGRPAGIRVLTVCPAQTDTELWDGKAPDAVRGAMMKAEAVGELVATLVGTDRSIDFAPIHISPPIDPWSKA